MEVIALKPLRTSVNEWEALEKKLKLFFAKHIYLELFKIIKASPKIKNAKDPRPLISALSEKAFNETIRKLDEHLSKINPERLAGKFESAQFFDKKLWMADQEFKENIKNITVAPKLSDAQRQTISKEWSNNMKLWIKDFSETEIKELRSQVFDSTFSGNRWESLTDTIKKSYGVSERKAKFLARQETHLLLAQFKQAQYTGAGVHEYIWRCVHRPHDTSPKHHTPGNVRYSHGLLNGKVFRWDSPPITSNPGEAQRRNNPGQDYNCRCYPRPIIRT